MKLRQEKKISSEGLNYLLYLPENYSPEEKFPLLLFLHGAGEKGHDPELVKKHGPPNIVEKKDLPFILVSPQCPPGKYWMADLLIELLHEVIEETNADRERIYGTGISMGGYGIWDLAVSYPDTFAALAPVCGGGDDRLVYHLKETPVWVFHGAQDDVIPVSESITMVQELKRVGGDVTFTLYPEAGHDCWTETYNKDELFEWFLKHRKVKSEA